MLRVLGGAGDNSASVNPSFQDSAVAIDKIIQESSAAEQEG